MAVVRARPARRVPRHHRQVGRRDRRHRRGHRHRPPHHRPPRPADRRRRPEDRRARGPGLRPPVRAAGLAGRAAGDRHGRGAAGTPRPSTPEELRATVLRLLGSPNLASKAWVTDQYDRFVQGNTALAQPDDAGVIRVDETTGLGVALATDANGRYAKLDPYTGAQLALAEAYRNVATVGRPPAGRHRLPQLRLARGPGLDVAARRGHPRPRRRVPELGVPVTGGNVSLYNGTGRARPRSTPSIHPTPVVGVLGVLDDVARATPSGWTAARPGRLPARHHARASSTGPRGPTSCTATSAGCRRRWTSPPSARSPRSWSTPAATAWSTPRTTSRGRPRPGARRGVLRFGVGVQVSLERALRARRRRRRSRPCSPSPGPRARRRPAWPG